MTAEYHPHLVADLHAMVRDGLSHWGLPSHTDVTLLPLSENATFRLRDDRAGRDIALRVHRLHYSSVAEIQSELAWVAALHRDGVLETAVPIAGVNGALVQTLRSAAGYADRQAVAFTFVSGTEPDPADDLPRWFRRLGGLTARAHAHARRWPRPAGFVRKRWDLGAMVGPQAYWGAWRDAPGLDDAGAAVIARALAVIAPTLHAYGMAPERFGLVHADLRLANLLVDGDTLRVIDFDDCGFSWFAYDFAAAVSFLEHEPFIPAVMDAWVAGYREEAPLDAHDVAMLPTFVMLRRILLTAWIGTHAEVPFARDLGSGYTAGTVRLASAFLATTR
jgi:Ser/Thr protein kinase RdoA (MazF antagonist)